MVRQSSKLLISLRLMRMPMLISGGQNVRAKGYFDDSAHSLLKSAGHVSLEAIVRLMRMPRINLRRTADVKNWINISGKCCGSAAVKQR
jgi:hypothetical protein